MSTTQNTDADTHEEVLIQMINLKDHLKFMSKLELSNGERIDKHELSAVFSSLSNDVNRMIQSYQNAI